MTHFGGIVAHIRLRRFFQVKFSFPFPVFLKSFSLAFSINNDGKLYVILQI